MSDSVRVEYQSGDSVQVSAGGYLMVCLCDLLPSDVHEHRYGWIVCNAHGSAALKLASMADLRVQMYANINGETKPLIGIDHVDSDA